MIERFDSFSTEIRPMKNRFQQALAAISKSSDTAGIAIVLEKPGDSKKILLVHPTGGSWQRPVLGIPKGRVEPGEEPEEAAFRECHEETGIWIHNTQVEPGIETVQVYSGSKFRNNIHYYVCRIQDPSEIGLDSERVPKSMLQAEEIDWAGFVELEEAYSKIASSQRIILDRLR